MPRSRIRSPMSAAYSKVASATALISRRGGANPCALTGKAGSLTDTYSYTAFGEVRDRTGTSTQPFQYLGNLYDSTG